MMFFASLSLVFSSLLIRLNSNKKCRSSSTQTLICLFSCLLPSLTIYIRKLESTNAWKGCLFLLLHSKCVNCITRPRDNAALCYDQRKVWVAFGAFSAGKFAEINLLLTRHFWRNRIVCFGSLLYFKVFFWESYFAKFLLNI